MLALKIAFEKYLQSLLLTSTEWKIKPPNFILLILGKNCDINMVVLNAKSLFM